MRRFVNIITRVNRLGERRGMLPTLPPPQPAGFCAFGVGFSLWFYGILFFFFLFFIFSCPLDLHATPTKRKHTPSCSGHPSGLWGAPGLGPRCTHSGLPSPAPQRGLGQVGEWRNGQGHDGGDRLTPPPSARPPPLLGLVIRPQTPISTPSALDPGLPPDPSLGPALSPTPSGHLLCAMPRAHLP